MRMLDVIDNLFLSYFIFGINNLKVRYAFDWLADHMQIISKLFNQIF